MKTFNEFYKDIEHKIASQVADDPVSVKLQESLKTTIAKKVAIGAADVIVAGVAQHLSKHIESYKAGHMDADTLGGHCVKVAHEMSKESGHPLKAIHNAIESHINKLIGESVVNLDEYNSRHDEHEWVKGLRADADEAARKAAPPKPSPANAQPVKTSAFAVMHHDGTSWKVTKHDDISGAAKEFARHSNKAGHRVKIVTGAGKVLHANHEAFDLDASEMSMLQECVSQPQDIIAHLKEVNSRRSAKDI